MFVLFCRFCLNNLRIFRIFTILSAVVVFLILTENSQSLSMSTNDVSASQPSKAEVKNAVNSMRNASKQSDMAMNYALKDNERTNKQLTEIAKGTDQLMAKIHKLGDRLADPHERSEKIQQRKQARLQKKIQRQYEKTQKLINFWTKKFCQHIEINNIYNDDVRKEDDTLQKIEAKLVKYGIDTDQLFEDRKPRKLVTFFVYYHHLISYKHKNK